ncbi:MAG: phosphoglycerate kinase, partial [Methanobrevibacter sp.]|nr:phosphoglycerate kinase [Methanobrevibacter sp.]
MVKEFNTIDDFDVEGKTVLVRIDINAPVDPGSGIILDDTRLKLHAQTVKELSNLGAKVVLLAHQSRPGKKDFSTLSQHADALSDILNLRVKYVDSLFSNSAKEAIKALRPHEILLLENVRFFSEETLSRTPLEQSKTHLVSQLSPLIDYYVNDAFAAAHRSQASLVGFTVNTPSAAGRVMEKELTVIQDALDNVEHPCVFLLGGMKPDDSIDVMENVLSNGTADSILTTGIVGNIVLWAA